MAQVAAATQIQPLAQKLPYAAGVVLKRKKKGIFIHNHNAIMTCHKIILSDTQSNTQSIPIASLPKKIILIN